MLAKVGTYIDDGVYPETKFWYVFFIKSGQWTKYLHPDGHIENFCGTRGFYKTELEAIDAMKKHNIKHFTVKIPDELFEIWR